MLCSPLNIELSDALTKQTGDGPYNSWPNHPETLHSVIFILKTDLKIRKLWPRNQKPQTPVLPPYVDIKIMLPKFHSLNGS